MTFVFKYDTTRANVKMFIEHIVVIIVFLFFVKTLHFISCQVYDVVLSQRQCVHNRSFQSATTFAYSTYVVRKVLCVFFKIAIFHQ